MNKLLDSVETATGVRNIKFQRSVVVVLLLIIVYILKSGISEYLVRSDSASTGINNTLCTTHASVPGVGQLCDTPRTRQFSKFIFVMTDAFPRAYSDDIVAHFRGAVYNTIIDGLKLSHAIMLSHYTGQPDTKFWASRTLDRDSIFDSMFRAGMKIWYYGKELSLMHLLGDDRRSKFSNLTFVDELHAETIHSTFFRDMETTLSEAVSQNSSMYLFSAIYDSRMHQLGHENQHVKMMAHEYIQNVKKLKTWIDKHDDYLLIIGADHGVDGPLHSLHGGTFPGNHGYLLFYNPHIPAVSEKMIRVVDVAPTTTGYFKNVDLPADSIGIPATVYERNDDTTGAKKEEAISAYHAIYKRTYVQLMTFNYLATGVSDRDNWQTGLAHLIKQADSMSLTEIKQVVTRMSEDLVRESRSGVTDLSVLFTFLILLGLLCFVIYFYNTAVIDVNRNNQCLAINSTVFTVTRFLVIVCVYFAPFFAVWSCVFWNIQPLRSWSLDLKLLVPWTFAAIGVLSLSVRMDAGRLILIHVLILALGNWVMGSVPESVRMAVASMMTFGCSRIIGYCVSAVSMYYYAVCRGLHCTLPLPRVISVMTSSSCSSVRYAIILVSTLVLDMTYPLSMMYIGFIHISAIIVYGMLMWEIILIIACRSKTQHKVERVIVCISLLLFTLWQKYPIGRLVIILLNVYYVYVFLPMFDSVFCAVKSAAARYNDSMYQPLMQTVIMIAFVQPFVMFSALFESEFSIDLDPYMGKVGLTSFDVHPYLSALLMALGKFGVFIIMILYSYLCVYMADQNQNQCTDVERSPIDRKASLVSMSSSPSAPSLSTLLIKIRRPFVPSLSKFSIRSLMHPLTSSYRLMYCVLFVITTVSCHLILQIDLMRYMMDAQIPSLLVEGVCCGICACMVLMFGVW